MLESARGIRKPLADSSLLLQKDGMLFRYLPPPLTASTGDHGWTCFGKI